MALRNIVRTTIGTVIGKVLNWLAPVREDFYNDHDRQMARMLNISLPR